MMRHIKYIPLFLALMLAFSLTNKEAGAEKSQFYTSFLSDVAVQGYDPVAYFVAGKATKGDERFQTSYQGATFYFSNAKNLAKFQQSPEAYAPQYGGYCAWAVSEGYTAKGDATHWHIIDGKLYLNYSESVKQTWESDIPGHIEKANKNWPNVLK